MILVNQTIQLKLLYHTPSAVLGWLVAGIKEKMAKIKD